MYYARRRRGLGATEPDTFTGSTGATGPVTPPAPPRAIGPPSTYQYFPGVYTPAPRSTAGGGSTQIQFVETAPRAGVNVGPTPKLTVRIPSPGRVERPEAASIFTPVVTAHAPAMSVSEFQKLLVRGFGDKSTGTSTDITDDQETLSPEEAKERVSLAENILAGKDIAELLSIPGLSSSNVKFLGKTLKLLEESTAAKVADIMRTVIEKSIAGATGYAARVPKIAEPAVKAVIKHGFRLSFATDAEKIAAKALAEEAVAASTRVGQIASEAASGLSWAGKLLSKVPPGLRTAVGVVGRGLETASGVGLVAEGLYDLTRMGIAYSKVVEANKDLVEQQAALRDVRSRAEVLSGIVASSLAKLPEDIRSLENERARLEDKVKQMSLTVERLSAKQQKLERESDGGASISAREFLAQQEMTRERDRDIAKLQDLSQNITDRTAAFTVARAAAEETAKIQRSLAREARALENRRARERFAQTFEPRDQEVAMHGLGISPAAETELMSGAPWAPVVAWTGAGMYGGWMIAANKSKPEKALYAFAGGLLGFAWAMYNKPRR